MNIVRLVAFEFRMSSSLFRFRDSQTTLQVDAIRALARCTNGSGYALTMNPGKEPPLTDATAMARLDQYGGLQYGQMDTSAKDVLVDPSEEPATWTIKMTGPDGKLQSAPQGGKEVQDLFLILSYQRQ